MVERVADETASSGVVPAKWRLAMVLVALLVTAMNLMPTWHAFTNNAGRGVIGFRTWDCNEDGFCPVQTVQPGTPAAKLGIEVGDEVRYDDRVDQFRIVHPGHTIGFTIRHAEADRHVALIAAPDVITPEKRYAMWERAALWAIQTLGAVFGVLILLRGGRQFSVFLIGSALICNGLSSDFVPFWITRVQTQLAS